MTLSLTRTETILPAGAAQPIAKLLSVTPSGNPAYLVVNVLDRAEYPATLAGQTGALHGNGVTLGLSAAGGDAREAGIVYTWQGGQYVNALYGPLSALSWQEAAGARGDVASLSLFTTSSATIAQSDAGNVMALMQADPSGYAGSITFLGASQTAAAATPQATPDGVAAAAMSFVGQSWNSEGCWVLASTIAAEAGAGLPVQSTAIGAAGHANGPWFVLYDGPVHAAPYWTSLVSTGDIVAFGTPGGGGHITTCVSGSGATAMLVDNITYESGSGVVLNPAPDGSASDVKIVPPHPATQEWAGVSAASVVIYALDTPDIVAKAISLRTGATVPLSAVATATDPEGRACTAFQVYDPSSAVTLHRGSAVISAPDEAHAVTLTSLSSLTVAGCAAGSGVLDIRAFNGLDWGDWQAVQIAVGGPAGLGLTQDDWLPVAQADAATQHAPALAILAGGATIHAAPDAVLSHLHWPLRA